MASTGVAMGLTGDAIVATLRQVAALAPGSTPAMTFMPPLELAQPADRPGYRMAEQGARTAGMPFISVVAPPEVVAQRADRLRASMGPWPHPGARRQRGSLAAAIIATENLERFDRMEHTQAERREALDRLREAFKDVPDDALEREVDRAVEQARRELRA